jgi:hypothetical protein
VAGQGWARGERARVAALGILVLGAMLCPLRQHLRPPGERVDGFPLSYYPMFSKARGRTAGVVYVAAIDADGIRHHLPHEVLGSGGFNQVRHQLNRLVRQDRARDYAARLAVRLAERPGPELVRVEVIRGRFDLDAGPVARRIQGREPVRASADVPRRRPAR